MTENFGQLIAPNYSARTSIADIAAYSFGGFLLSLPFLPFPHLRFYFAIFTFAAYVAVFLTLGVCGLVKILSMNWSEIWQIELIKIKMEIKIT